MLHKRLSNTAELVDCAGLTAEMAMGNVRQNEETAGNSSVVICHILHFLRQQKTKQARL